MAGTVPIQILKMGWTVPVQVQLRALFNRVAGKIELGVFLLVRLVLTLV